MNRLFSKKGRKDSPAPFAAAFFACLALGGAGLFAADYYAEGEALFRANNPAEAIPLLYEASLQPDANPNVFVYLGLCYHQEGRYDEAVSAFMRGTLANGADTKALFFNAGNVYFDQELFSQAEDMYTRAIQANGSYAPAYLNRANARVKLQKLGEAVQDYSTYLTLDPASWQKDSIASLISLLNQSGAAVAGAAGAGGYGAGVGGAAVAGAGAGAAIGAGVAGAAGVAGIVGGAGSGAAGSSVDGAVGATGSGGISGGAGIAGAGAAGGSSAGSDAERAAAEERFRRLMDEITSSLQSVDGASVFSAGSEDVMGYDEEGEIE